MFVGHLALALAAKRVRPATSLGWFVAAVTTADLLWPIFLLLGFEHVTIKPGAMAFTPIVLDSYPFSHSLAMLVVWGVALALVAKWSGVERGSLRLIIALVVSHWVLDFVTHAPDMPLVPGAGPKLGLGLWNSIPGTYAVEGMMWVGAIALYLGGRTAVSWVGRVAFWSFVIICTAMWAASPFGPPPPDERSLAWFSLIGWIVVPWTAWADRGYRLSPAS